MSVPTPPAPAYLSARLRSLALSSPPQTGLFYARIWHSLCTSSSLDDDSSGAASGANALAAHEAVHVLALAFLANDEPYSALHLVRDTAEQYAPALAATTSGPSSSRYAARSKPTVGCLGCATLVARACEVVGRYSEGAKVLERAMRQHPDADPHTSNLLLARMSHKGKEPDIAAEQYMKALSDNVWLWEAYTALCDLGAAPLPEHTFPAPPSAIRTASSATLRASAHAGPSFSAQPSFATSAQAMAAMSNATSGRHGAGVSAPRDSNPFGTGAGAGTAAGAQRHTGPGRAQSPPVAGTSRYGARGLQGGLMANMTPGAGYDDSMMGRPGAAAGAMGLFTPDVGGESVLAGRGAMAGGMGGMGGQGGVSRVQMLGGNLWDTPSTVSDTTFPSVQPMRRVLPSRATTAPAASSAVTTPAMGTTHPTGPPAMKRARGPGTSSSTMAAASNGHPASAAGQYETPVNFNGSSSGHGAHAWARAGHGHGPGHGHGHGHGALDSEAQLRRGQRDLKSIEPNADADLPPRRSTRLKVPAKPTLRLTKASATANERATRGAGLKAESRSRSATATSLSGASDMTSSPLDLSPYSAPLSAVDATADAHAHVATDAALQHAADVYLLSIVRAFALAYRALSTFDTVAAVSHLDALPPSLHASPLALSIIAVAFYEQADYVRSKRAFVSLFQLEPYRLTGVHLYSTLLWHLADVPALSTLAQGSVAISKDRPEAWVAVGNCMSLGGDHEAALRCFRRAAAVGVDEGVARSAMSGQGSGEAVFGGGARAVAYAYTLAGYEAVELEQYERAVRMYRLAIRTDGRLYNAWYGLGQAFLKMSKLKYAEHHFRRAVEINPSNPVLLCCIGQVLEAQEDHRAALATYTRAALLPSTSTSTSTSASKAPAPAPLVQFKRIRMLIALDNLPEALSLLEPLARELPDEAQVQLLLGKCLLSVGRKAEGVQALTEARELAPRLSGRIGRLIGGEESEEEDDD